MSLLTINNLSKKYRGAEVYSVEDLSLEVKEGEVFGFLGPNGAGKSTTIKCVTGILPYEQGSINVCGYDLKTNPLKAKQNMGFVSDDHMMYDQLTAREYINFVADIYNVGVNDRKKRTEDLLEQFELTSVFDNQISSYSHGMKQKICVIGVLVHNPKLWILDEPLTGLDPKSAFQLKEIMKNHCKEGNSVFFSSHMLDVVEKVCDRVAIINKGKLIMSGDMDEIKGKSLENIFLNVTGVVQIEDKMDANEGEIFSDENK